jgi:hypothetical protein
VCPMPALSALILSPPRQAPVDVESLSRLAASGGDAREAMLASEAGSKAMQMSFATLKPGAAATKEEAEALGVRWRDLLATDALKASVYALSETELLYTEEEGRILELRNFLLAQPEIEKFRWKDTDFTPADLPRLLGGEGGGAKKKAAAKRATAPSGKKAVASSKKKVATPAAAKKAAGKRAAAVEEEDSEEL